MIANKTTEIDAQKTVTDIQAMLAGAKATQMLIEYEGTQPVALSFKIDLDGYTVNYRLPCNYKGVLAALMNEKKNRLHRRLLTPYHANRVAWRIIRDWLRAQLSIIEANASTLQEVMLPWAITNSGKTVGHEMLLGHPSKLLGLPGPSQENSE